MEIKYQKTVHLNKSGDLQLDGYLLKAGCRGQPLYLSHITLLFKHNSYTGYIEIQIIAALS